MVIHDLDGLRYPHELGNLHMYSNPPKKDRKGSLYSMSLCTSSLDSEFTSFLVFYLFDSFWGLLYVHDMVIYGHGSIFINTILGDGHP